MSAIVLTFQFQLGFWLLYHKYYFEECVGTGNNNLHPVCYLPAHCSYDQTECMFSNQFMLTLSCSRGSPLTSKIVWC